MPVEHFKAEVTSVAGLKVVGKSRDFEFIMDEPRTSGGTDKGMNPVEALLNALGGCEVIVVKAFARAKNINIKSVRVELEGEIDTDGYMYKNPEAKKGYSNIKQTFYIESDNSEEEVREFIEFVEQTCPVLDTILDAPTFETKVIKE